MEKVNESNNHHHNWGFMENLDQDSCEETSTISNGSLSPSISSSSSLDDDNTIDDDASSSSSVNSAGSSLHDLSDLMSQLPIKRGLSKFYHGKSESFTSLARVISIEDLPKKLKNPYNKMRKMKGSSKSYGGGLDNYKSYTLPKPIISKKSSPFLRQKVSPNPIWFLINKTTSGIQNPASFWSFISMQGKKILGSIYNMCL